MITRFPTQTLRYATRDGEQATLPQLLDRRVALSPDACFVSFDGEVVTYAGFRQRAEQAAAALADVGVSRGSTVGVMLPNCVEFLDLWFGSALLGAVLVPINTGLRGESLAHVLEHSACEVLVAEAELTAACDAVLPAGHGPRVRFARGSGSAWPSAADWLAGAYAPPPRPILDPADTASILYTSGTTGPAKGVLNRHNAFNAAASEFCRRYVEARAEDVLYTSLPLFHVNAAMLSAAGAMVSGLPLVLAPRFSASGILDDARAHGATVFNYIGAMLTMIAKQPRREDDADNPLRLAIGGAAPAELWRAFEARFGLSIVEIYGLTETATFCLGSPPAETRVGKIGLPVSWAEVRIQDADGNSCPTGEAGEIVVRSTRENVLFAGYHKNPDATAQAMAGGWFHTGDRGRRDEQGYFEFIDRIKDVIRRRGENISSFEVERVVDGHPAVAQCAAVGVPADVGEEDVMIVVVPVAGQAIDPAELIEFCRSRMGTYMVPRYVQVTDSLPRTATERVQKYALRAQAATAEKWDREARA